MKKKKPASGKPTPPPSTGAKPQQAAVSPPGITSAPPTQPQVNQPPFPGAVWAYDVWWKPGITPLGRELVLFRMGIEKAPKSLGRFQHFKNAVNILWGPTNKKMKFEFHPYAERMLEVLCDEMDKGEKNFVSIAGCASSGKTQLSAVWAIINWLAQPDKTCVLVTSTSLKDSRKRIWGCIEDYFTAIPGRAPGKLVSSAGTIRFSMGGKEDKGSARTGITLIAAEKSRAKETVGKLLGFKSDRVLLICDEMPELSESIAEAAYGNLAVNKTFMACFLGNPASRYDAFGVVTQPKDGWSSIHAESEFWETARGGVCLRLDGLRSPNILAKKTLYPYLFTEDFIEQQRIALGENSATFWRMVRGYFSPTGAIDGVYSEADIVYFKADQSVTWMTPPMKVAAMDPSFTNSGDRTALYFGKYGESSDGLKTLLLDHCDFLSEDVTNKAVSRTFQIAQIFKDRCEAFGVAPENACFDATGAGNPLGDVIAKVWSGKVHRVEFGGKASELPASPADPVPASTRYKNKVSEIWWSGRTLMRTGQLRGVTPSLAKELTARTYTTEKSSSMRICVESKVDMKLRIGKSPDEADAALMLVELCRVRFGFGISRDLALGTTSSASTSFPTMFRRLNCINAGRSLSRV